MDSKGQMFLIAAVVIVAALVTIKVSMSGTSTAYDIKSIEVQMDSSTFSNIVNEMNNTMIYASNTPQDICGNVHEFINFTRSGMASKSKELSAIYVGSISNHTLGVMNVSVVNSLGSAIDVNISIPGQSSIVSGLADQGRWDSYISITPGAHYTLYVWYNTTSGDISTLNYDTVQIDTKNNRDVYDGFLYMKMDTGDALYTQKYQKSFKMKK